jgi:hypothetical protein
MARTPRKSTDALDAHLTRRKAIGWPETVKLPEDEARREAALTNFAAILEGRSANDWAAAELIVAGNLSLLQVMLNEAQSDVFERGLIIDKETSRGSIVQVQNPSIDVVTRLTGQSAALASKLSVFATTGASHLKTDKASMRRHAAADPARLDRADDQPRRLWRDRPQ